MKLFFCVLMALALNPVIKAQSEILAETPLTTDSLIEQATFQGSPYQNLQPISILSINSVQLCDSIQSERPLIYIIKPRKARVTVIQP